MPTLAATLRSEIRRLAAKEVQKALKPLRRAQRQLRSARLALRQQRRALAALERRLARLKLRAVAASGARGRRISPEGIHALRGRLGMSRKAFAALLGVSPGSIFGWESGRTLPRGRSRARLAEVRRMGVRAARTQVMRPSQPRRRRRR